MCKWFRYCFSVADFWLSSEQFMTIFSNFLSSFSTVLSLIYSQKSYFSRHVLLFFKKFSVFRSFTPHLSEMKNKIKKVSNSVCSPQGKNLAVNCSVHATRLSGRLIRVDWCPSSLNYTKDVAGTLKKKKVLSDAIAKKETGRSLGISDLKRVQWKKQNKKKNKWWKSLWDERYFAWTCVVFTFHTPWSKQTTKM